jgi:hypothetical protein
MLHDVRIPDIIITMNFFPVLLAVPHLVFAGDDLMGKVIKWKNSKKKNWWNVRYRFLCSDMYQQANLS